ncbi:leucine-rich repeat-containing protein 15-like [Battus philenor]|uniref:leucine-rich repeat-containing protein 15-like n=1 Tax=Battus philenor TaxID=42288 RepID=UPI0035D106F9
MYTVTTIFVLLLSASLAASSCPKEEFHRLGFCVFQIKCFKSINGVELAPECRGSVNDDVIVDLTLLDVDDSFQVDVTDNDFLISLTSLKVLGAWPKTNLNFLELAIKLKKLSLSNLQMKIINGSPFRFLYQLEVLDLSHNSLSNVEDLFVFDRSNKMKKLYLSYNEMKEIPSFVFQELTGLLVLDLSNNLIEDLNEEPFSNLTNLETLKLNNNFIKNLNGAINKNLLRLTHLFLNNNEIANIDEKSYDKIYHLETFEISNNKLEKLPPIFLVRHWNHLNVYVNYRMKYSRNRISALDNVELDKQFLQNIDSNHSQIATHLDLSGNRINRIAYNAFQSIQNLISLDVSNNALYNFIVDGRDLATVKYLNISGNFISSLDFKTFSLMGNLQSLDLSDNRFENIHMQSFIYLDKLERLNFSHNDIQQVLDLKIHFHYRRGIIDLSNNNLTSFAISPGEAEGLVELILNSNNISDAAEIKLKYHRDLMKLDMSKNFITFLDEKSLQLPLTLVYLDLSFNSIQVINPSAFFHVKHLHTLHLGHNYLSHIEHGVFRGLTSLLNLDLSFNRIIRLDSKVLYDLKSLQFLVLRHNAMIHLECSSWIGLKTNLIVYIDGNSLSCDWLAKVLWDYNNGYSKMHPASLVSPIRGHSLEGIPCIQGPENLVRERPMYIVSDERLLATIQKILEAVQTQTSYLRKYVWRSVLQEANKENKIISEEGKGVGLQSNSV